MPRVGEDLRELGAAESKQPGIDVEPEIAFVVVHDGADALALESMRRTHEVEAALVQPAKAAVGAQPQRALPIFENRVNDQPLTQALRSAETLEPAVGIETAKATVGGHQPQTARVVLQHGRDPSHTPLFRDLERCDFCPARFGPVEAVAGAEPDAAGRVRGDEPDKPSLQAVDGDQLATLQPVRALGRTHPLNTPAVHMGLDGPDTGGHRSASQRLPRAAAERHQAVRSADQHVPVRQGFE